MSQVFEASTTSFAGLSGASFAVPPLNTSQAQPPPRLGPHGGRFEQRSMRVQALLRTTEKASKSVMSGKASDLCPDSVFAAGGGSPMVSMTQCANVWKERLLAFDAGNDGWTLTISKSLLGKTTVKHTIPLVEVKLVQLTVAPDLTVPFKIKARSSVDTMEGVTADIPCTAVITVQLTANAFLEFTCRRHDTAVNMYETLQKMKETADAIRRCSSEVKVTTLGTADEKIFATIRISDLVPMKPVEQSSTTRVLQPMRAPHSAALQKLPPITFECTMSFVTNKNAPELKLKGRTVTVPTATAAAGNFDAEDGTFPGEPSTPASPSGPAAPEGDNSSSGNAATKALSAKLIVLLDAINANPPVLNNGKALGVWVEADRDRMLMARLTLHPQSRHTSIAELRTSIVAAVGRIKEWQEALDSVPAPASPRTMQTPSGSPTRPPPVTISEPSSSAPVSPRAVPTEAAQKAHQLSPPQQPAAAPQPPPASALRAASPLNIGVLSQRPRTSLLESETFSRKQLVDLETEARHMLRGHYTQATRLTQAVLKAQAVLAGNQRQRAVTVSSSPQREAVTARTASPLVGKGHPAPTRERVLQDLPPDGVVPQPYLGYAHMDYRSVVGYILRHRAAMHTAAGGYSAAAATQGP
jgi:hypothetical protein